MKKAMTLVLSVLLLAGIAACGAAGAQPSDTPAPTGTAQAQNFTGKVQENKLFMITLEDDAGNAYVFGTEAIGEAAMNGFKAGDQVTVTYTGDLSEVGGLLEATSIEKAAD